MLEEYVGVANMRCVNSCTSALMLALRALEIGPGDEVIVPTNSFIATAEAVSAVGATPRLVDVDAESHLLTAEIVAENLGPNVRCIIPVHLFGATVDLDPILALAQQAGVHVVEDACQALGAVDEEGRMVGTRGNFSTFAFYANKQMTTGEGGMIIPTDADAAARLRSERNQGRAVDMGWLDHDRLGFNYRLSDVSAAIGLGQVEKLPRLLSERAAVAARYGERLATVPGVEAPMAARGNAVRSWFVYVVRLADEVDRDAVIRGLREVGIDSKSYLPSVHLFPHLQELGYREGQFPVAEAASAHSLALPFFPQMTEAQIERVCTELARTVDSPPRG